MSLMFNAYIIDDDPGTVSVLRSSLNKLGCEVIASEVNEESIARTATENKIDVAFVSLSLRTTGARKAAKLIQTQWPQSKIILITGWKGVLDSDTLSKEGFSGVLRRPPRFSDIKSILIDNLG